jgi:hypothetical protein
VTAAKRRIGPLEPNAHNSRTTTCLLIVRHKDPVPVVAAERWHPVPRRTGRPSDTVFCAQMGQSALDRLSAKSNSVVTFEPWPVSHGESNSP